jgi:hypothetical protein
MLKDLDAFVNFLPLVLLTLLVVDPDDKICIAIRVSRGRLFVWKLSELDLSNGNYRTSNLFCLFLDAQNLKLRVRLKQQLILFWEM